MVSWVPGGEAAVPGEGADEPYMPCLWIDTVFPFRSAVRFLGFWVPGPRFVMVRVSAETEPFSCTQEVVALPVLAYSVGRPTLYATGGRSTTSCVQDFWDLAYSEGRPSL